MFILETRMTWLRFLFQYGMDDGYSYPSTGRTFGVAQSAKRSEAHNGTTALTAAQKWEINCMDEYIKREEIRRAYEKLARSYMHGEPYIADWKLDEMIEELPAADVAPMRHGRWENGNPICPVCGGDKFKDLDADIWCDWKPAFCPNCGAKMDLDEG